MKEKKSYHQYVSDILSDKIIHSDMVTRSVQRFINDLERSMSSDFLYVFIEEEVDRIIIFLEQLQQFEGEFNGKKLKLEGWQCFIIANLIGWRLKSDTTIKRFQRCFIMVGRKNGKSFLFTALALMDLLTEPGAQVCSFATTKDQSKIILRNLKQIILKNSELGEILHTYREEIHNTETAGRFFCLSKEAKSFDGMNVSYGLADEVAAMKDSFLVDVVQSSQGARQNPMLVEITTAGYNFNSPGYIEYEKSKKILNGQLEDERFFTIIFQYDKADRWDDPANFIKANPNLNVSVKESYLLSQLQDAKNSGSKRPEFMTKHCNIFLKSFDAWFTPDLLNRSRPGNEPIPALEGLPCFGASDLSIKNDFTAYTNTWYSPETKKYYQRHRFYIPENSITERFSTDSKYIFEWAEQGFITLCAGDVIDLEYVYQDIRSDIEQYCVKGIATDPYRAQDIQREFPTLVVPFPQSNLNMSGPISKYEKEITAGNVINLDNNPVWVWMMGNAQCKALPNNLLKIGKVNGDKTSGARIDGVITSIMSLSLLAGNTEEAVVKNIMVDFDALEF